MRVSVRCLQAALLNLTTVCLQDITNHCEQICSTLNFPGVLLTTHVMHMLRRAVLQCLQVMEEGTPGPVALIIDCPDQDYVPSLTSAPQLRNLTEASSAAGVAIAVHLAPHEVKAPSLLLICQEDRLTLQAHLEIPLNELTPCRHVQGFL